MTNVTSTAQYSPQKSLNWRKGMYKHGRWPQFPATMNGFMFAVEKLKGRGEGGGMLHDGAVGSLRWAALDDVVEFLEAL